MYIIVMHKRLRSSKKEDKKSIGEIVNFYDIIPERFLNKTENPNYDLHNIEIPFRACVCAPSGSGKTNFILNLIKVFSKGKGTFTDIYIITQNKDEPLYNWLAEQSNSIRILEGLQNTPKLSDFDKEYNHLVIWDDLVLNKNLEQVEKYYMRARKQSVSVLFLSQSYVDIPKFIRKNSNYLILFDLGGSKREQDYILREWGTDLERDDLRKIYNDATSVHMRPLIIKGGKTKENEKYRKGFLEYYDLKSFLNKIHIDKKSKTSNSKGFNDSDSE